MHRDACDVFDPRSHVRIQNRLKAAFQWFTGIFLIEIIVGWLAGTKNKLTSLVSFASLM
jgi:hypothetical protein